ncbi:hypothetical protein HAX54_021389 [Datura stramonium]|uniref:Uncharacterized protein n=1 Tax=Datura stramonium TaxID=4076 RepID=A0ABS8UUM1_DATST|nr:hypothetical protein [Datura stramonium]
MNNPSLLCGNNPTFPKDFKSLFKPQSLHGGPARPGWKIMQLCDELGFNDLWEVPGQRQSGGIVLLWNTNLVTLTYLRQSEQELHATIQTPTDLQPSTWGSPTTSLVLYVMVYLRNHNPYL